MRWRHRSTSTANSRLCWGLLLALALTVPLGHVDTHFHGPLSGHGVHFSPDTLALLLVRSDTHTLVELEPLTLGQHLGKVIAAAVASTRTLRTEWRIHAQISRTLLNEILVLFANPVALFLRLGIPDLLSELATLAIGQKAPGRNLSGNGLVEVNTIPVTVSVLILILVRIPQPVTIAVLILILVHILILITVAILILVLILIGDPIPVADLIHITHPVEIPTARHAWHGHLTTTTTLSNCRAGQG